ncbi:hypothetical protein [Seonamhaeicola sp. ML3]|uniref:hypothetical protein n=1 Tax=Seonamhaeicola sp. ML3 TaxID=2937786 RepID=UPI00200D2606|nr:hypothetical protein [Seonamhaeicola sp. ML3]
MKQKVLFLTLVFAFSFLKTVSAQNDKVSLFSEAEYIALQDLVTLHQKLKQAPMVHEECLNVNCENIERYQNALYNLNEDIKHYQFYLEWAKGLYKKQWELYYQTNVKNVKTKLQTEYVLMASELLSNTGSVILDVVNIANAIKNPGKSKNFIGLLNRAIDTIDVALSALDIIMKYFKEDPGTNYLNEVSGNPNAYNYYTELRAAFEGLRESIVNAKEIKEYASGWNDMTKMERLAKLDNPTIWGLAAAIGNLLGLVATDEQNKLKEEIKQLDDLLKTNQDFQGELFNRYHYHFKLLDKLDDIRYEIENRFDGVRGLGIKCKAGKKRFTRNALFNPPSQKTSYSSGLKYYKPLLSKFSKEIDKSWLGVESCENPLKPYKLVFNDGLGKRYFPFVSIVRLSDGKEVFKGSTRYKKTFDLAEGLYKIDINQLTSLQGFRMEKATIPSAPLFSFMNSDIIFTPYGRVQLEVVDENNKLLNFGYEFKRNDKVVSYGYTATPELISTDLQANVAMTLSLRHNYKTKAISNVILKEGQLNKLRFVFNGETFHQEELEKEVAALPQNPNNAKNNTSKDVPTGWVKGTLYNSNNGTCQHKNKVLVFRNNNSKFLNLETNTKSEYVAVAPGQSLQVAIPKEHTFLRVSVSKNNSMVAEHIGGTGVSFLRMDSVHNGWWYSVGCKNGTRPSKLCDNGKGERVYGSGGSGHCGTLGE